MGSWVAILVCQHCTRDGVAVVCWTSKLIKPRRPVSRDGSINAFEQCKQRRSEKAAELGIRVSYGTGRYRGEGDGVLWVEIRTIHPYASISRPRAYRHLSGTRKAECFLHFQHTNRPLNLMTGTHNAHRQGRVGTTVKATTVEDRYGKPVNYAHFQGKRKQGHWSGHAPKILAIFYSCPQINSSWESVHSDKSARCFTSEFPCIADSFVFMLKLKLGISSF